MDINETILTIEDLRKIMVEECVEWDFSPGKREGKLSAISVPMVQERAPL